MMRLGIGLLFFMAVVSPAGAEGPSDRLAAQGRLIESRLIDELPTRPDDGRWDAVPAVRLRLFPQVSMQPGLPDVAPMDVSARFLFSGRDLAVYLDWADGTDDRHGAEDTASFADAAALQFATPDQGGDLPYIGMGEPGRPVGLWYWRAGSRDAERLEAEGFGSLRPAPGPAPRASGVRRNGGWRLVLTGTRPHADGLIPIAVAVWDGAVEGRAGRKWLSAWMVIRVPGSDESNAAYRAMLRESEFGGDPARGAVIANELGCNGCHTLPGGERTDAGPDLTFAGGQHWPGYLRRSIAEPSAFIVPVERFRTPGEGRMTSLMPKVEMDASGREDLVSYLTSLRGPSERLAPRP